MLITNRNSYQKKYSEKYSKYPDKLKKGIQDKDNYIFSKLTEDIISDISYYLNSTNFLIKDKRFIDEKEFRFVIINLDEKEEYVYLREKEIINEIIIVDLNMALSDKSKMYELIDICRKNGINYRIEK